jgi:hypothetical protein
VAVYTIRYTNKAAQHKASLPEAQRVSLETLEKKLSLNPFGHGASSNRDNSWSAVFAGGFITYVVSNRHVVINVIAVTAM